MPNHSLMHEEKREIVKRLIDEGLTKKQICKETGIPLGTISHLLRRWDLKTRNSYSGNKTSGFSKFTKYESKKQMVFDLVSQGVPNYKVADIAGIPRGSIVYVLRGWGYEDISKKVRGKRLSATGAKLSSKKVSASHKRGRKHHLEGLVALRGHWVKPQERLDAILECVEKDMTYTQMVEDLQLSQATIWKVLKDNDLLQGIRKGDRHPDWKGGHSKYRGPDWYTNRKLALKRDGYVCQFCGKTNDKEWETTGRSLNVHHIVPYAISNDSSLKNLITCCQSCHMIEEQKSGRHSKKYAPDD